MKTKYVIRYQKIGETKIHKGKCHAENISNLIASMGKHGYHVINYCEDSKDIYLVRTGRN